MYTNQWALKSIYTGVFNWPSPYFSIILASIAVIFQVINGFIALGHKGCTPMSKLSEITVGIRKETFLFVLFPLFNN
jgi:hypothetical protein